MLYEMKMTHGSLFSGIDGFGLAAEWMGWENVFTCEIDDFCNIILENNFKHEKRYKDIKTTDFSVWRGRIDVLSGGFPCQPYSQAGKRLGKEDERHLWPEMLRAIREVSPRWVVGENVRGIINWDGGVVFDEVCSDLEALGYEILPLLLPAAGVNAPHERYRVFFVAHADHPRASVKMRNNGRGEKDDQRWERFSQPEYWQNGSDGTTPHSHGSGFQETRAEQQAARITGSCSQRDATYADEEGLQGCKIDGSTGESREREDEQPSGHIRDFWEFFPTQPPVCNGDDGFSTELLRRRIREDSMGILSEKEIDKIISSAISRLRKEAIKAGGNAVVVPLVHQIFKAIQEYENNKWPIPPLLPLER